MLTNSNNVKLSQKIDFPKIKGNYFCVVIFSIIIWILLTLISQFCPNFLVNKKFTFDSTNFCVFYVNNISASPTLFSLITIFNLIFTIIGSLCQLFFIYYSLCTLTITWKYDKWFRQTIENDTKIISSCQHMQFSDKIAMLVPVCNDFLPSTIIQTANQTYKNIDVWIISDSTNATLIDEMKKFCLNHKFHFLQHDSNHRQQHPTKIGNIFYFLEKYGNKYDYIFENDSSSIVSKNFVYNSLCFLHSPLLNHENDACVTCNTTFYPINNLFSFLNQKAVSHFTSGIINNNLETHKCLTGYGAYPCGACCLIKTSIIKKIPLNEIETTMCDILRGYWLLLNNYKIYFDPFDFGGKISAQSVWNMKNQRHKWIFGDIFAYRKSKFTALKTKYDNKYSNYLIKANLLQFLMTPITFIVYSIKSVFWFIFLSISKDQIKQWFNFTSLLLSSLLIVIVAVYIGIIALYKCKWQIFTYLMVMICSMMIEFATSLKRIFTIIIHFFTNNFDWKKINIITSKKRINSSWSKILKQILFDLIIVLLLIGLCLMIQFLYINKHHENNIIAISYHLWFGLFILFAAPSIVFIILRIAGNIKTNVGYDFNMNEYKFWHHDFRYKTIKNSFVWKQQNKDDL